MSNGGTSSGAISATSSLSEASKPLVGLLGWPSYSAKLSFYTVDLVVSNALTELALELLSSRSFPTSKFSGSNRRVRKARERKCMVTWMSIALFPFSWFSVSISRP